ncbi:MAG: hypothetical protein ABEJ83_00550 [Candidatus Nanohaloarchaea archaeon]
MRKGISTSTLMPLFAVFVAVSIAGIAVTGNQGVIPSAGNWLENALNSSPEQCRGHCEDGDSGNGGEDGCGDGTCGPGETPTSCPTDCSQFASLNFAEGIFQSQSGNWWVIGTGPATQKVYKFTSGWSYTGTSYKVGDEDVYPMDLYQDSNGDWWMVGNEHDKVYKYGSSWESVSNTYDISDQVDRPGDLFKGENGNWWVANRKSSGTASIYKYDSDWNYVGEESRTESTHDISGRDEYPSAVFLESDGSRYVFGQENNRIYRFDSSWNHQETINPEGIPDNYAGGLISAYRLSNDKWWAINQSGGVPDVQDSIVFYGTEFNNPVSYQIGDSVDALPVDIYIDSDDNIWILGQEDDSMYRIDMGNYGNPDFVQEIYDLSSTLDGEPIGMYEDSSGNWWITSDKGKVYKFDSGGSFTGTSYDLSQEDSAPTDVWKSGGDWYMLGWDTATVYNYGGSWPSSDSGRFRVDSEDDHPTGIYQVSSDEWWMVGESDKAYRYNSTWDYQDESHDLSAQDMSIRDVFQASNGNWMVLGVGGDTPKVYNYTSGWDFQEEYTLQK